MVHLGAAYVHKLCTYTCDICNLFAQDTLILTDATIFSLASQTLAQRGEPGQIALWLSYCTISSRAVNYVDAWTCLYAHSSKVKDNLMQMSHPLIPHIKSRNSWHEVMMGI